LTEQSGRKLAWILLALWAGAYLWSIASVPLTAPKGDGFTRGLNKITAFYGWQILAAVLSIAVLWSKRYFAPGSFLRRAFWAPIALAGLLLMVTGGVILYANYGKPAPVTSGHPPITSPPAATTAPAEPTR